MDRNALAFCLVVEPVIGGFASESGASHALGLARRNGDRPLCERELPTLR